MKMIFKIGRYQLHDVIRSKWILFYTLFLLAMVYGIISLANEPGKILITLLNINLIIVPLVSLVFGTVFLYNNRNNITFLTSQPIKRSRLYLGLYIGLVLPLSLSFFVGLGLPIVIYAKLFANHFVIIALLMLTGILLTIIFVGISFYISIRNEDRMKGLGLAIIVWLFFSIFYDGILLLLFQYFADYPIEKFSAIFVLLNPVDLTRILVVLKFDISALMGYTGTIFTQFFSGIYGYASSIIMFIIWIIFPLLIGLRKFNQKDF